MKIENVRVHSLTQLSREICNECYQCPFQLSFTAQRTHSSPAVSIQYSSFPTSTYSLGQGTHMRFLSVAECVYSTKNSKNVFKKIRRLYGPSGPTLRRTSAKPPNDHLTSISPDSDYQARIVLGVPRD